MKVAAGIIVGAVIFATIYGVIFSIIYPLVETAGPLIGLFAILGLATSLIFAGIWKAITKR